MAELRGVDHLGALEHGKGRARRDGMRQRSLDALGPHRWMGTQGGGGRPTSPHAGGQFPGAPEAHGPPAASGRARGGCVREVITLGVSEVPGATSALVRTPWPSANHFVQGGLSMPAAFVRLFLVRHAEALANPNLRYLGSRDDPLTERGQWQALQLAQAFAPLDLAAVYTSPLTRAVATAAPIAEAHGLAIIPEPRLVEAAMGTWKGLRRAEILARSADDAARHHQWEADPTCAPPGGGSLAAVQPRG